MVNYERKGQFMVNDPEPWVFGKYSYPIGSTEGEMNLDIYEKEFTTFKDCVLDGATRKPDPTILNESFIESSKKFVEGGSYSTYLESLKFVEESYECSGSCKTNLFFATKDVSQGKPQITCVKPLAEDLDGVFFSMGVVGIVCGSLLFCTALFSYCLCKPFKR